MKCEKWKSGCVELEIPNLSEKIANDNAIKGNRYSCNVPCGELWKDTMLKTLPINFKPIQRVINNFADFLRHNSIFFQILTTTKQLHLTCKEDSDLYFLAQNPLKIIFFCSF